MLMLMLILMLMLMTTSYYIKSFAILTLPLPDTHSHFILIEILSCTRIKIMYSPKKYIYKNFISQWKK